MESRPLGRTRLVVSRLGLGLAALGRPGYITVGHAEDLRHDYDVAAMEALRQWKYAPTILGVEAVPVRLLVTITFERKDPQG